MGVEGGHSAQLRMWRTPSDLTPLCEVGISICKHPPLTDEETELGLRGLAKVIKLLKAEQNCLWVHFNGVLVLAPLAVRANC